MDNPITRAALLLALLALIFYSTGAWWGAPHAVSAERVQSWGIDDESPLGPLAEIHNILEPKEVRWLSYPLMYSFVTAAAYAPYMGYLLVSGGLSQVSPVFPFGLEDPVKSLFVLTLIAHFVSVIMGALTVASAYDVGRTLASERSGIMYALFVMVSFPLVYYARNGNVDAMALGFAALAVAVFFRIVQHGMSLRSAAWLGVFAGFSLATKETSIGVFLLMPIVLLYYQFWAGHSSRRPLSTAHFWKAAGTGMLAAILAFGLGSGLFVDPGRYFAHVEFQQSQLAMIASSSNTAVNTYDYSLHGQLGYLAAMAARIADAVGIPGCLLVIGSILFAARQRPVVLLPAILALVYFVFLLFSYRLAQVRYLLPFFFLLLFYAGWGIDAALRSGSVATRAGVLVLGLAAFTIPALKAVDLTYQMINDSRYAAADWLRKETKAGDVIAYFGPVSKLPHLEAGVLTEQATDYAGMYSVPDVSDAKVNEILSHWSDSKPRFVVIMPDHTHPYPVPYSHTVPPQLFSGLKAGTLGYRQVAYFHTPALIPWLQTPVLDYQTVNPPIHVFVSIKDG